MSTSILNELRNLARWQNDDATCETPKGEEQSRVQASLVRVAKDKDEKWSLRISTNRFVIGRDDECQLRFSSPLISKRHCCLWIEGDQLFVEDLGSTNGTLVNKSRISAKQRLQDGDLLRVGKWSFQITINKE